MTSKSLFKISYLLSITILILSVSIYSCGSDDEEEPAPNEQFFGTYTGMFNCVAPFDDINDENVTFEITPPADANATNKVTVSTTIANSPISFDGTVSGNTITFTEKTINDISGESFGIDGTLDVSFSGTATLNGNALTADLTVRASIISGNCTFSGTKG